MQCKKLFDDGQHQWFVFGRDSLKPGAIIDTNEYLVMDSGTGFMMDPGGIEIFPSVLEALSVITDVSTVEGYLCSHQDPDIMSSLPLWMALTPKANIYLSWLWSGFVAHFGSQYSDNFVLVPDEGQAVTVGQSSLQLVPAHHCHSSGNFHLYDPKAKIFFSGDMGSALVPADYPLFVEDFSQHTRFMDKFHRRWMPSNEAKQNWVRRLRKLKIDMICPQHGAIFAGENVGRFLDWIEDLNIGASHAA